MHDADEAVYESVAWGGGAWRAAQTLEFNERQGPVEVGAGAGGGGTVPRRGRGARWPLRVEVLAACGGAGDAELPPCLLLLQRWPPPSVSCHLLPESQRRAPPDPPPPAAPLLHEDSD